MSVAPKDVVQLLTRELETFTRELQLFPDDESVWETVPGIPNSAGNLALHVAGGLQYFIGGVLGGTGYRRNRELEFSRRSGNRTELVAEIQKAAAVVREVLPHVTQSQLADEFPEPIMGFKLRTDLFLTHLCVHTAFHLGQAGYVRRAVTGDPTSSGPISLQPLSQ